MKVHVLILGDFHLVCLGTGAYYGNSRTRTDSRAWTCEHKRTLALACPFHGEDLIKVGYAGAIVTFGGARTTEIGATHRHNARKSIYAFTFQKQEAASADMADGNNEGRDKRARVEQQSGGFKSWMQLLLRGFGFTFTNSKS